MPGDALLDTVSRWGGDEFTVLVEDVPHEAAAVALAERIERAVSRPIRLHGDEFRVTASVGLTFSPADEIIAANELLHKADSAMYQSKRQGEGGFRCSTSRYGKPPTAEYTSKRCCVRRSTRVGW